MQGIFIAGKRPKSKKAIREAIEANSFNVYAESTSFFANGDYEGPLSEAPVGTKVHFVGPDPERLRNFYGTLHVTSAGIKVS